GGGSPFYADSSDCLYWFSPRFMGAASPYTSITRRTKSHLTNRCSQALCVSCTLTKSAAQRSSRLRSNQRHAAVRRVLVGTHPNSIRFAHFPLHTDNGDSFTKTAHSPCL